MVLKKFSSILNKRPSAQDDVDLPDDDYPEGNAVRGVRLFCESGSANSGDEVLHLPLIVESAVATTAAAAAAANQIRRFLSKENLSRPHVQYNAIMLIRILADNPGPSFTRNMDTKFVDTVKSLLRKGQDASVRQILIETLNALDREKAYDTNLNELFAMWRKEQGLGASPGPYGSRTMNAPAWTGSTNGSGHHSSRSKGLPAPIELAARIEEARTSAKLLLQLVQSTPPAELFSNDLIKEFAGRCQSAQRSIQGYINCDNPAPDDDTMLTLIETNEQLSLAASKHQRAVLQARKALGVSSSPSPPLSGGVAPPPGPPPQQTGAAPVSSNDQPYNNIPPIPAPLQSHPQQPPRKTEDPFSDDHETYAPPPGPPPSNPSGDSRAAAEPYHPGYQSTPSYVHRQESAGANLTMHGGAVPAANEANEGANTGTVSTVRSGGHGYGNYGDGDVSPIETRSNNNNVTYRY